MYEIIIFNEKIDYYMNFSFEWVTKQNLYVI